MTDPIESPASAPKPDKAVGGALVLFAVSAILLLTLGAAAQIASLPAGLAVTEVLLILLPAVLYVRLRRLPVLESLRVRPIRPATAARSALLGILAWPAAVGIYLLWDLLASRLCGPDPTSAMFARAVPDTALGFAVLLLVGAVLPGICEEALFRGAIQGILEKRGVLRGVVLTALLFGVFHFSPWNLVPAAALGLLMGLLVVRTGSSLCSMICHASVNAVGLSVAFALPDVDKTAPPAILYAVLGVSTLGFIVALLEFLRHTRGAQPRPSPLTLAPTGVARATWWAVLGAVILLPVLAIGAFFTLVTGYHYTGNDLSPEVNRGDRVLCLRTQFINVDIKPGDIVVVPSDPGKPALLRKVGRVEADTVFLIENGPDGAATERPVPRQDVTGKMFWRVSLAE